jgi:hypothetical protein
MKEYKFSYMTAKNTVAFDDISFRAKIGPIIKKGFSTTNLQNFYLFSNNDYQALYITYLAENGKAKKVQLFAGYGEASFKELVDDLSAKFPAKSLNHLTEAEAFKIMKTANPNKLAPVVVAVVMILLAGIFMYPMLRHALDFGYEVVTVEQLIADADIGTRNVKVRGLLIDSGVEETIKSRKSSTTTVTTYYPMVDTSWREGKPINVILQFGESYSGDKFEETEFVGVIRNVAWEGIGSDKLDYLKDNFKLNIPAEPLLVEVTDQRRNDIWSLYVFGGIDLFVLVIVLIVARRMKSK